MSENTQITLSKGGTDEKTLPLSQVIIPDLWDIGCHLKFGQADFDWQHAAAQIFECWNIAHDLKNHIAAQPD